MPFTDVKQQNTRQTILFFQISDGLTPKVMHCGKELLPELMTDTRLAVVEFKSDNSIRRKGFKIAYDLVEGTELQHV